MVNETIEGTLRQTNLANETAEYLDKREELRLAEIELMRHRESSGEADLAYPRFHASRAR